MNFTKTICLILAAVLFTFNSRSQEFKTSVSEPFPLVLKGNVLKIGEKFISVEDINQKVQLAYTAKLEKALFNIRIRQYNSAMEKTKEIRLSEENREFGPFQSKWFMSNNQLYLIYHQFDEEKVLYAWAVTVNCESPELGQPFKLLKIDIKRSPLINSKDFAVNYKLEIERSPDSSRIVVFTCFDGESNFSFSVFDKDLKFLWSTAEQHSRGTEFVVHSLLINNNEDIYFTFAEKEKKNSHWQHFLASRKKDQITRYTQLQLPSGEIHASYISIGTSQMFGQITGLYKPGKSDYLQGVFSVEVSSVGNLGTVVQTPFDPLLIKRLDQQGWGSKKFGISSYLQLRAYTLDGGKLILCGDFRRVPSGAGTIETGSIIQIHFESHNPIVHYIPKFKLSSIYFHEQTYYSYPYRDRLIVFFNDESEGVERSLDEWAVPQLFSRSVLMAAWIDSSGEIQRKTVVNLEKENFVPNAKYIIPMGGNRLLIPINKIEISGGITRPSRWGYVEVE